MHDIELGMSHSIYRNLMAKHIRDLHILLLLFRMDTQWLMVKHAIILTETLQWLCILSIKPLLYQRFEHWHNFRKYESIFIFGIFLPYWNAADIQYRKQECTKLTQRNNKYCWRHDIMNLCISLRYGTQCFRKVLCWEWYRLNYRALNCFDNYMDNLLRLHHEMIIMINTMYNLLAVSTWCV